MYPASPAALPSYLVLHLIECDTLRRQKSQLIQSNKLPTQSEGGHTSSPHPATHSPVNLCLSGLFFNSRRWADLKSWGPEYSAFPTTFYRWFSSHFLECGHERHKVVYCFSVFSIIEKFARAGVFIHPSKHSHLGWLDSECATRVYQIPKHSCMHAVVILKPKTYNISATATFELLN